MVKEIRDTFLIFLQDDQGSHGSGILTLRENVCLPVEAGRGQVFKFMKKFRKMAPCRCATKAMTKKLKTKFSVCDQRKGRCGNLSPAALTGK